MIYKVFTHIASKVWDSKLH